MTAAEATGNRSAHRERLLRECLRIRRVEEKIIEVYPSDKVQSPVHLSIGQEAVAVGLCDRLETKDLLFCTYRSHAFYLAKGGDINAFFAELYGKTDGCGGGKAGSMHLAAPEVGLMGASAVVASTIPHALGAAMAARLLGKDQKIVCAFGDGSTEEGVYHECLNFAALRSLPVLLLCENNGLAVHAHLRDRQAFSIQQHAKTFGMPVMAIDEGWDPVAVSEGVGAALAERERTGGPVLLEVATFRYKEHVGPGEDWDAGYRDRAALAAWMARDPLVVEPDLTAPWGDAISDGIAPAPPFAEASPWPGPAHPSAAVR